MIISFAKIRGCKTPYYVSQVSNVKYNTFDNETQHRDNSTIKNNIENSVHRTPLTIITLASKITFSPTLLFKIIIINTEPNLGGKYTNQNSMTMMVMLTLKQLFYIQGYKCI